MHLLIEADLAGDPDGVADADRRREVEPIVEGFGPLGVDQSSAHGSVSFSGILGSDDAICP
jgi:hypothetical protein